LEETQEGARSAVLVAIITHRIHGAGIYANIWGILMGSMLTYIATPWILWDMDLTLRNMKIRDLG
jgi:hypothetical protein